MADDLKIILCSYDTMDNYLPILAKFFKNISKHIFNNMDGLTFAVMDGQLSNQAFLWSVCLLVHSGITNSEVFYVNVLVLRRQQQRIWKTV